MNKFDNWEEDLLSENGTIRLSSEEYEHRKSALEQAKDIHSGLVMGTFTRDELVWEFVRRLEELRKC